MKKNLSDKLSAISVVSYRFWAFLSGLCLIFFLIGLWAFFGYIPVTIKGKGIFVSPDGLVNIQAKIEGMVENLNVVAGQQVKAGENLFKIYDSQLELKLFSAETHLKILQTEVNQLYEEIAKEKEAIQKALQSKLSASQFNISQLNEQIIFLSHELKEHKALLDRGLISGAVYHKEEQVLIEKRIEHENKVSLLNEMIAESKKEYRLEEFRNKEQQLLDALSIRDLLLVSQGQSQVISSYDGRVLEVMVNSGDQVHPGTPMIWLEKKKNSNENPTSPLIYAYFSIQTGERIHINTPVEISVPQVNQNEYGSIEGKIISISRYAVSLDNIYNKIQNFSLAKSLIDPNTAVVEIIIKPQVDPQHPQDFKWSSGKQPPNPVSTGTLGSVTATIEKVRPIYFLLPLPKFKSEE